MMVIEAFQAWMEYRRLKYLRTKFRPTILKLILPNEINKSPQAMEIIYSYIWNQAKSVGGIDQVYWDGRIRPEVSLELASIGGNVAYYIYAPNKLVSTLKSNFYAQYPGIEIEEVPDYLEDVDDILENKIFYGFNWRKKNPPPDPIVTYRFYGLDQVPDAESRMDPLVQLIEFLGSLTYGETCSYQMIFRPNTDMTWEEGEALPFTQKDGLNTKTQKWIKEAKEKASVDVQRGVDGATEGQKYQISNYLPGEPEKIKAFRNYDDQDSFDVIVRGIYIGDPESFKGYNIGNMSNAIKQFSHGGGNFVRSGWETGTSDEEEARTRFIPYFGKKWQDWISKRRKKKFLLAFKRRSAFYPPNANQGTINSRWEVFNEELATIYHLVGTEATTPTLDRVGANKSDPPGNLPV